MDKIILIGGVPFKAVENPDGTHSAAAILDGTDATGVSQATGGTGARGWLSSIYRALCGSTSLTGALKLVTTAGTRTQLPNIPCREVTVIGLDTNTGSVFAGGVNVSLAVYGVKLGAKEAFTFAVANANQIYIDSSISGEGVSYVAI